MARRSSGVAGPLALASLLGGLQLGANCVDGVTPDCADAAAQCGAIVSEGGGAPVVDAGGEIKDNAAADDIKANTVRLIERAYRIERLRRLAAEPHGADAPRDGACKVFRRHRPGGFGTCPHQPVAVDDAEMIDSVRVAH